MKPLTQGILAAIFFSAGQLSGCMAPILKIEKECTIGKFGGVRCKCRDKETGQFVLCPPEWKAR